MVNNKIKKGLSVLLALAMTVSGMGVYAPTEVNAAASATEGLSKEEALDSFGLVGGTEEKPDAYGENTVGPYGNAGALINPYYELLVSKSCFTGLGKENCYTQEFSYDLNTVTDDKGLGLKDSNAYATTQSYGTEKFGLKSVALDLDGDGKQERIAKAYINGSESGSPLEFTVGKTVLQRGVGKRQVTELTKSFSSPFYKADSWEFKRVRQRSYGAGVSLASGDFDGDEKDEVALVSGNYLYIYDIEVNSQGEAYISNTRSIEAPYQNRGSSGIEYVAVSLNTGDMNGDGVDELIVSQRDMVVIYSAQAAATAADGSMMPGGISTMKSVFSSVIRPCENADSGTAKVLRLNAVYGDADGDGRDELIFAYNDTNTNLLKKSFLAAGYFTYKSEGNTGKFGQFTLTKNAPVYDNNGTDIYYFTRTLKSGSAEKSNGIEAKSWNNRNKLIDGTDADWNAETVNDFWYPIPLAAAHMDVNSAQDTVFIDHSVYQYISGKGFAEARTSDHSLDSCVGNYSVIDSDHSEAMGVTEAVAGNFTGTTNQTEQFCYVMTNCAYGDDWDSSFKNQPQRSQYKYEVRMVSSQTGSYDYSTFSSSAITGDNPYDIDNCDEDEGYAGDYPVALSITRANLDNDSAYGVYESRRMEYSDPKVIAVLASTPYFEDQNLLSDGFASNGGTSFGQETSSGTSSSQSASMSVGAYMSFEVEVSVPIASSLNVKEEAEYSFEAETSLEFSDMVEKTYAIEYESQGGEDSVVVCTVPKMIYTYKVRTRDAAGNEIWVPMDYAVPLEPISKVQSAERYDQIAVQYNRQLEEDTTLSDEQRALRRLPVVYDEEKPVLTHTIGDPTSYLNTFRNGDWYAQSYVGNNVGNSSITQSITTTKESEKSLSTGFTIEESVGAGAGGLVIGAKASQSVEIGRAEVHSSSSSISGTVMNAPYGEDSDNYSFNWRIGAFNSQYDGTRLNDMDSVGTGETSPNTFVTVTYQTAQVTAPPATPVNLEITESGEDSLTVAWEDPATVSRERADYYVLYRKAEVPGQGFEPVQVVNEEAEAYTTHTYEDTELLPGINYTYYIKAYNKRNKGSIASEEISGMTLPAGETLSFAGGQPKDVLARPGDTVTLEAQATGLNGQSILYQWQKLEEDGWTNVGRLMGGKAVLQLTDVSPADSGTKYRVRAVQKLNGSWIHVNSEEMTLTVARAETDITIQPESEVGAFENGRFLLKGNAKVTVAENETHELTGTVRFTLTDGKGADVSIEDADGTVKEYYDTELNADGTASYHMYGHSDQYGKYMLHAKYMGSGVYNTSFADQTVIVPKDDYISVQDAPKTLVYGDSAKVTVCVKDIVTLEPSDKDHKLTVTTSDNVSFRDGVLTAAGVGTYTMTAEAEGLTPVTIQGEIVKRKVTVKADGVERRCNEAHIEPTFTITNLAENDNAADMGIKISCVDEKGNAVNGQTPKGSYTIQVSGGNEAFLSRYEVEAYEAGTYRILNSLHQITYEQPLNAALEASVDGEKLASGEMTESGQQVLFTVTPNAKRYRVAGWLIDGKPYEPSGKPVTEKQLLWTVEKDTKVEAVMESFEAAVTFNVVDEKGGSLTAAIEGSSYSLDSGSKIVPGTTLRMTAAPEAGYEVESWIVNGETYRVDGSVFRGNVISYPVDGDESNEISVRFIRNGELLSPTLSFETHYKDTKLCAAGAEISAVVDQDEEVESGDEIADGAKVIFTMDEIPSNMILDKWEVNGTSYSASESLTVTMEKDTTVYAVMKPVVAGSNKKITYSVAGLEAADSNLVTLSAATGTSSLASGDAIPVGQPVVLAADAGQLAAYGYEELGWSTDGGRTYNGEDTLEIAALNEDVEAVYGVKKLPKQEPDDPNKNVTPQPDKKDDPVVKTTLTISEKKLTVGVKEKVKLTAAVTAGAASAIRWESSNKAVAAVANGVVTAKKTGTAVISAEAADGSRVSCNVTVKAAPKKLTLTAKSKKLKKGKSYQIRTKLLPATAASHKLTYTSSKKAVAVVSATGKVTAKKKGTAYITVRTYNNKKARIKITVK